MSSHETLAVLATLKNFVLFEKKNFVLGNLHTILAIPESILKLWNGGLISDLCYSMPERKITLSIQIFYSMASNLKINLVTIL